MMDFLDPKKSRAHTIRLYVGYVLLAIAITLAAIVLLYQAGGYGVNGEGKVIQNGLVFVSSAPGGAQIYLDGDRSEDTNTRLNLPAGTYTMRLSREGYRDWQRALTIEGGGVQHVDYPMLFPNTMNAANVADYRAETPLATQSPDRRWLLVQVPGDGSNFDIYDTRNPDEVVQRKTTISVPAAVLGLTSQTGQQTYQLAEWSRDNDHVLLRHVVGDQSEYIMLSRSEPESSLNLTKQLQLKPTDELTLRDKKYDKYFLHDKTTGVLATLNLDGQAAKTLLNGVISYKSYGENVVLYVTTEGAAAGKVSAKLYQFERSYQIRQLTAGDTYLLDLSTYSDDWYAVAGSPAEDHVYVYENPAQKLREDPDLPLVPSDIMKLNDPGYVEFSANSQLVMAENGQELAVYDVENERSFSYRIDKPLDAPQQRVTWLDGFHLLMVSGGVATVFDYDGTNVQSLVAASPGFTPFFDTAYQTLYTIAPKVQTGTPAEATAVDRAAAASQLTATPLRTERDR